jgi:hypothetical protein
MTTPPQPPPAGSRTEPASPARCIGTASEAPTRPPNDLGYPNRQAAHDTTNQHGYHGGQKKNGDAVFDPTTVDPSP